MEISRPHMSTTIPCIHQLRNIPLVSEGKIRIDSISKEWCVAIPLVHHQRGSQDALLPQGNFPFPFYSFRSAVIMPKLHFLAASQKCSQTPSTKVFRCNLSLACSFIELYHILAPHHLELSTSGTANTKQPGMTLLEPLFFG